MKVMALSSFDHDGLKFKGNVFEVSQHTAEELVDLGLCELVSEETNTQQEEQNGKTVATGKSKKASSD